MSEYAERDVMALDAAGEFYVKHVTAMTAEGLHSKADIAAELAWRDSVIEGLKTNLFMAAEEREDMSFNNGYRSIIRLKGEWNTRPLDKGWNDAIRAALRVVGSIIHPDSDGRDIATVTRFITEFEALLDQQPEVPK